ncbi:hypothetical protein F0562_011698 [Nyssa sinensis]|uniref:Uncharacterized protein n=1 Tax=Nyssa sinensis TaxID=561372 RepID=A0A5J4ZT48_9ASTE|nr:hypothetical protein F0562_011698 [Nyssa sinensis]
MLSLKSSYMVKPAKPTPNGRLELSECDQVKPITHTPTVYFYRKTPTVEVLKESLSQALIHFYPLAGRVHWVGGGRVELQCNAMGVLLNEAESKARIEDFGDFCPTPKLQELIPSIDYSDPIDEMPLLVVQLTRFSCGGASLGLGVSHVVADGRSSLHFVAEWARIARGEPMAKPPLIFDQTVLQVEDPFAAPQFHHSEYSPLPLLASQFDKKEEMNKETAAILLRLNKTQVDKLKKMANYEDQSSYDAAVQRAYSRFEAVAGHVWRCASKARGHDFEQLTEVFISVDCRGRMLPPLPQEFFGNGVFLTAAASSSGDLMSKPLNYASRRIREAVEKMTDGYVRSALNFLKNQSNVTGFRTLHDVVSPKGVFYGNPNLQINSWLGLPLIHGADFGWGKEIYMGPAGFDGSPYGCFQNVIL